MATCTFVISRGPSEAAAPNDAQHEQAPERRVVEDALVAALCARGARVLVVPHIYYLADGHEALARLAAREGRLVVGSWLHSRAAYWVLRTLGLADVPAEEGEEARRITCLDLASFDSPEAGAEAMAMAGGLEPGEPTAPEEVAAAVSPRWYPVVDGERCVHCGKCRDFCLFGVYTREGDRIEPTYPDRCKDGCPACSRLCPKGAILFPHYAGDPAIAGAPGAEMAGGDAAIAAFLDPAQAQKERAERSDEGDDLDDLDDLIDALDKLDE